MRDKDGFIIKCIESEWMIYNDRDDEDDICRMFGGYKHCYGDESCPHYRPERREVNVEN